MNVVLYERYSSSKQSELSIEGQDRVNREFCDKQNYKIIDTYIDRAQSGTSVENRSAFQKTLKDSEEGRWEAIIVYKLDRFSRNRYDIAITKNLLSKYGVKIISATENISDDPEGIILESVLEGMAEYYSKELSQKVKRGMMQAVLDGHYIGGAVPLGYKIENKKIVIDKEKAPIIIEAFNRFDNGDSIANIIKDFNNRGLRNTRGGEFNKYSFEHLFKNEMYIGKYIRLGQTLDNIVPSLISEDLFYRVNNKIKTTRKQKADVRIKQNYLLSTKLFCTNCNLAMVGTQGHSKYNIYAYYTCPNHQRDRGCDIKPIRKEWIENIVYEETKKILNKNVINDIAGAVYEEYLKDKENGPNLNEIEKLIKDIEKQIKRLTDILAVNDRADLNSLVEKIKDLEKEKKELQTQKAELNKELPYLDKSMIIFYLETFIKEDKERILKLMVNRVYIKKIKDEPLTFEIKIIWNISNLPPIDFTKPDNGRQLSFVKTLYYQNLTINKTIVRSYF